MRLCFFALVLRIANSAAGLVAQWLVGPVCLLIGKPATTAAPRALTSKVISVQQVTLHTSVNLAMSPAWLARRIATTVYFAKPDTFSTESMPQRLNVWRTVLQVGTTIQVLMNVFPVTVPANRVQETHRLALNVILISFFTNLFVVLPALHLLCTIG